ncbi:MAG: hypothetical protein HY905_27065 [Deltaproteobacteria bacterium]|nr:hypothetical protein [Deltaproteobacteria bacterium]
MVAAPQRAGFQHDHTTGDHALLTKPGLARPVIVPQWDELPDFIVSTNLRTAGIGRKDYIALLGRGGRRQARHRPS